MTWKRFTHPLLPKHFMIYLWTMMLFNGPSLTMMPINVTIYQIYNLNSTTSCSSTPISIPCNPLHMPRNLVRQKSPQTTSIFKSSIIESSLVSHSWYLEDSAQVWEGYAAKPYPRTVVLPWVVNAWNNGNTGKTSDLKTAGKYIPVWNRNRIFNTNYWLIVYTQVKIVINIEINFHRHAPASLWI